MTQHVVISRLHEENQRVVLAHHHRHHHHRHHQLQHQHHPHCLDHVRSSSSSLRKFDSVRGCKRLIGLRFRVFGFSGSGAYFKANPDKYNPFLEFQAWAGLPQHQDLRRLCQPGPREASGPSVGMFRIQVAGFGLKRFCCRVWIPGFGFRASGLMFRAQGLYLERVGGGASAFVRDAMGVVRTPFRYPRALQDKSHIFIPEPEILCPKCKIRSRKPDDSKPPVPISDTAPSSQTLNSKPAPCNRSCRIAFISRS